MTHTKKAIERLNKIDWKNIGQSGQEKDMELGIEFIVKMAVFCNEKGITPSMPFMTDVSSFLEDCVLSEEILNKCNSDVRNIIENPTMSTLIVEYYIKASVLADSNIKYVDCMDVYEPIIKLFEKGGNFVYRERGMSFINSGLIPLNDWFENYKKSAYQRLAGQVKEDDMPEN